jgi:hypothetical protein
MATVSFVGDRERANGLWGRAIVETFGGVAERSWICRVQSQEAEMSVAVFPISSGYT